MPKLGQGLRIRTAPFGGQNTTQKKPRRRGAGGQMVGGNAVPPWLPIQTRGFVPARMRWSICPSCSYECPACRYVTSELWHWTDFPWDWESVRNRTKIRVRSVLNWHDPAEPNDAALSRLLRRPGRTLFRRREHRMRRRSSRDPNSTTACERPGCRALATEPLCWAINPTTIAFSRSVVVAPPRVRRRNGRPCARCLSDCER
jgi:hypothetical protein